MPQARPLALPRPPTLLTVIALLNAAPPALARADEAPTDGAAERASLNPAGDAHNVDPGSLRPDDAPDASGGGSTDPPEVDAAGQQPQGALEGRDMLSGALILNPEGLYARYDHGEPLADSGFWVGGFATFLFYSNELGVQLQYITDPALVEVHLDLAFEPGFFRKVPTGQPPQGEDAGRTAATRFVARAQSNINLQLDHVWLYSRTTALYRHRDFLEDDTILELQIAREYSLEQAAAAFVRLAGTPPSQSAAPEPAGLWLYAEYTLGGILDVGTRPNRVSLGLLSEDWPRRGTTLNLDLFYSFAAPIDGPGLIFAWWVALD